jgi:hypothetical protein
MKLTLTIETQDPAELARVAQALNGIDTGPQETQAAKPRPSKAAASPVPVAETKTPQTTVAAPTADVSSEPPTPAALNTSVNAACSRLGNGGPAKVKAYIAANFTKPDGTPGGLVSTADAQKPALLKALNEIAAGTITL